MSKANRIVLWLLVALVLGGISWYSVWFINNFERQTETRRVEVSPEAGRNPFLAAERYLLQLGYLAESIRGRDLIAMLPPAGDALLLKRIQPDLTEEQLYTLNDWIEAGGVLIVTPHYFAEDGAEQNLFFRDLGVGLYERDPESMDDCSSDNCSGSAIKNQPDTRAVEDESAPESESKPVAEVSEQVGYRHTYPLTLDRVDGAIAADFRSDRYLADGDQWAIERSGDQDRWNYLRYEIGNGTVVVLSDLDLFSNDFIGDQDHAYLLSHIVGSSRKVWLQYSVDMLPLPQLLWQRIPFLVIAVVILLLAMGWRLFSYTGPRLQLRDRERRNLLEHIDATAAYAWRIDRGQALFESNRQALEKSWRKRHPALNSMDQAQRSEWIGEKTGMSGRAVERSLYHVIDKDQDFIKATLVLQQLASGLKQRELR